MRIDNVIAVVVGVGEIGRALAEYLSQTHNVITKDVDTNGHYKKVVDGVYKDRDIVLHICIPYANDLEFCQSVSEYIDGVKPTVTIVHSTVPVGTCRKLGVVHSPISGRHPFITESLNEFTKFVGGDSTGFATEYLRKSGFRVYATEKQESTELLKLDDLVWWGTVIEKTKETKDLCDKYNVPFELFTIWRSDRNRAVVKLGQEESIMPNLIPIMSKIGGHCTLEDCVILNSEFAKMVLKRNER